MNKISLNPIENQNYLMERDILSAFREQPEKSKQIQQGMSPVEIADIISDRLMDIIKKEFETVKQDFIAKNK